MHTTRSFARLVEAAASFALAGDSGTQRSVHRPSHSRESDVEDLGGTGSARIEFRTRLRRRMAATP